MKILRRELSADPVDAELTPFLMEDGVTQLGHVALLSDPAEGAPLWSGLWICEPRSWSSDFATNEIVYVVSGSADVHLGSGELVELRPGSLYRFDRGEVGRWEVKLTLKAFAVLS